MTFARKQKRVALGMGAALLATIAAFWVGTTWSGIPRLPDTVDGRASLWAQCSLIAGVWPIVCVSLLAHHRFITPQDIDGGGQSAGTDRAKKLQAMLQNTLEQTILAVIGYAGWCFAAPAHWSALPALLVTLFAVGRLLFLLGYLRGAPARAFGFALTFYPTFGLYLALVPQSASALWRLFSRS